MKFKITQKKLSRNLDCQLIHVQLSHSVGARFNFRGVINHSIQVVVRTG